MTKRNGKPEIIYQLRGLEILNEFNIPKPESDKKQKTLTIYCF